VLLSEFEISAKFADFQPASRWTEKTALIIADFECSTERWTFKISAAFFVQRKPASFSVHLPFKFCFMSCLFPGNLGRSRPDLGSATLCKPAPFSVLEWETSMKPQIFSCMLKLKPVEASKHNYSIPGYLPKFPYRRDLWQSCFELSLYSEIPYSSPPTWNAMAIPTA
jgi:hypothetical protein